MKQPLADIVARSTEGLLGREIIAELVVLAAVAEEHLLIIGPPGTAKSEAVRRIAKELGGSYFEYLLGKFTEPSELFGAVNLEKLKDGVFEVDTSGMLPEADFAFLDEVFLGSTAILNTLLALLNERQFRKGKVTLTSPLRVCVGASNTLPDDDALAAFADRFLLRSFVDSIPDSSLEDLLEASSKPRKNAISEASLALLDEARNARAQVDLSHVRDTLADCIRRLRNAGIGLTDRRIVRSQNLVAAAAALAGRTRANNADLWPLIFVLPTAADQELGRTLLKEVLQHAENAQLLHAAAEASSSLAARRALLRNRASHQPALPTSATPFERAQWERSVEAFLKELDCCFAPEQLDANLTEVRKDLSAALSSSRSVSLSAKATTDS